MISLVTPVYNTGEVFLETASSVLAQTFDNWEWLIVDDGSDAETLAYLVEVADRDERIRLIQQVNAGAPVARNRGVAESRGEWVKFLDADDLLEPQLLDLQYRAAQANPDKVIFSESKIMVDIPDQKQTFSRTGGRYFDSEDLLLSHLLDHSGYPGSFLFPRAILDAVGPWDEGLIADQDGDYIMRTGIMFPQVVYVPDIYFIYRHHQRTTRISVGFTQDRLESRICVCEKIISILQAKGCLARYALPMAQRLDALARVSSVDFSELTERALSVANQICPNYPLKDPWYFNMLRRTLGLRRSEMLKRWFKKQN